MYRCVYMENEIVCAVIISTANKRPKVEMIKL